MRSRLHHHAPLEHEHDVRVRKARQAVRAQDDGDPLLRRRLGPERLPERGDDGRLGRDVDGRERIVEDKESGRTCGAAAARARANPRRCRWPPEIRTPASPIWVSRPCGNPATSSSMAASRIACR